MKFSRIFFTIVFISFSAIGHTQCYRLYDSSKKFEYKKNGSWLVANDANTTFNQSTLVRCESDFQVAECSSRKLHSCPPCTGAPLGSLLDKHTIVKQTSTYTWKKDGSVYDVMREEPVLSLLDSLDSTALHYLIVDIHQFEDDAWQNIGAPNVDANRLDRCIRHNLITNNNLHVGYSKVLNQLDNTTLSSIRSSLDELQKSINESETSYVIIYLSSHGMLNHSNEFMLITSDSSMGNIDSRQNTFLHEKEINDYVRKICKKNAKVLLFVDACKSGTIIRNLDKSDDILKGEVAYFASTSNDLYSYQTIDGSPFATALIRAINGDERIYFNMNENVVTPRLLELYIRDYVSKKQYGQDPISIRGARMHPNGELWQLPGSMSKASMSELKKAADYGNTAAMIELASCYAKKDSIRQPETKQDSIFFYLNKAYVLADKNAVVPLAICYYYGIGVKQDYKEAYSLFKIGAADGKDLANYYLSVFYTKGYDVKQNKKEARFYMHKIKNYYDADIIKASQHEGIPLSGMKDNKGAVVMRVGMIQSSGKKNSIISSLLDKTIGDSQDSAIYYSEIAYTTGGKKYNLEDAARNGNRHAMTVVGYNYLHGKPDFPRNYLKALFYLEQAAHKNDDEALYYLYEIYSKGIGVEKDEKKAYDFLVKAVELKNLKACVELGNLYFLGKNELQHNDSAAFHYWNLAAQRKDCIAQYKMGLCYKYGIGTESNESLAISWLQKAASNRSYGNSLGKSWAKYELGRYYLSKGEYNKAYELLMESSNLNNYKAAKLLTQHFYSNGDIKKY